MKKLLSLLIVLVMALTVLTGCGKVASGTDLAKLMLANQRLNAQLLKNEGDIFEAGAQTLGDLASQVKASLTNASSDAPMLFASTQTGFGKLDKTGGKVEVVDGTTFTWSGFEETSNSVSYLDSYAQAIIDTAERGAEMIDQFKQKVGIVDQWVRSGVEKLLLHVEENSETLLDQYEDQIDICKRTRDSQGNDVYEMYIGNNIAQTRMTYVKGKLLEHSIKFADSGDVTNIVAVNDKGYWEVGTFDYIANRQGPNGLMGGYNVAFTILKDDLAYHFAGLDGSEPDDVLNNKFANLNIISSDKKTDIMHVSDSEGSTMFELKFSGFAGIANVTTTVTPDQVGNNPGGGERHQKVRLFTVNDGEICAVLDSSDGAVINLENGNQIAEGNSYLNDAVLVRSFGITATVDGYLGSVSVAVNGNTYQQRVDLLKQFLQQVGLECRRDIDDVFVGVATASDEQKYVQGVFRWNGSSVATREGLDSGLQVVLDEFVQYDAIYQQFKDAPTVSKNAYKADYKNMDFAEASATSSDVAVEGRQVTIGNVSVQTQSSPLVMEGERYQVGFGLANTNGQQGIVHLDYVNNLLASPTGDTVVVTASQVTFELPVLLAGNYNVVAYVCTIDGIRISQYLPIKVDSAYGTSMTVGNVQMTVDCTGEFGVVTYSPTSDVVLEFAFDQPQTVQDFCSKVAEVVYNVGTLGSVVERYVDGNYIVVDADDTIGEGSYRLAYSVNNGDNSKQGYVFVTVK